jgi:hypothetical protein
VKDRIRTTKYLARIIDYGIGPASELTRIVNYRVGAASKLTGVIKHRVRAAENLLGAVQHGIGAPGHTFPSITDEPEDGIIGSKATLTADAN